MRVAAAAVAVLCVGAAVAQDDDKVRSLQRCSACPGSGCAADAAAAPSCSRRAPPCSALRPALSDPRSRRRRSQPPQQCPAGWEITGVDEWIQGETTLDAGALTMVFFFSQSCHICHDVAPNLNKMYKKLRGRGLQIIGVHSTPKGYKAKGAPPAPPLRSAASTADTWALRQTRTSRR